MGKEEKMNLEKIIDFSKVISESEIQGADINETRELKGMLAEAKKYISAFKWCMGIDKTYLGVGFPGIIAVFLFKIRASQKNVDEWLWVIVGDVPPAYISVIGAPDPAAAIDGYVGAMEDWVNAVKSGKDVDNLIPVNVPPVLKWAERLEARLNFIDKEILPIC